MCEKLEEDNYFVGENHYKHHLHHPPYWFVPTLKNESSTTFASGQE
jgi:hypothetical protein